MAQDNTVSIVSESRPLPQVDVGMLDMGLEYHNDPGSAEEHASAESSPPASGAPAVSAGNDSLQRKAPA